MNNSIFNNATFLALGTAVISGVSIFINKFAVTGLSDPVLFSGFKNTIVALFLLGIILAFKKQNEIQTITKSQWKKLLLIGLVGGSLPFALFFTGLSMIPAINGAMIHKTLFIWVAILATFFLKERFTAMQWIGVSALFGANIVIGGFNGFSGSVGELLILGSTLLWAIENIIAKKILSELSSITVASARMIFGSFFLLVFLTVTGRIAEITSITLTNFGWVLLTAFFLLGYVLTWYTALKYAPASYVASLLVSSTLVTNILSAIFITGTFTKVQALSGFLVILGSTLLLFYSHHAINAIAKTDIRQLKNFG